MSTPPHITRACAALDGVLATPVSARALATPTFPFFQDIVAEVSGATGFGLGLYDPSELKCRTAEAKRTYISKIAGFVGASLGTPVPPKPIADAVLVGGSARGVVLRPLLPCVRGAHTERLAPLLSLLFITCMWLTLSFPLSRVHSLSLQANETFYSPKPQQVLRELEHLKKRGKVLTDPIARAANAADSGASKSNRQAVVPTHISMPPAHAV